jgi:DNA-binding transcriptional ArsR family regulator
MAEVELRNPQERKPTFPGISSARLKPRSPTDDLRDCLRTSALHATIWLHIVVVVDGDMDKVFKALADSGRRLLLDRLRADNGQTLGQLCEHLDMSRQAVTKHLKRLEAAGLVATIWRGREKFHYLNPVPIHEIAERWIGKYEQGRLRVLEELKKNLEGESHE